MVWRPWFRGRSVSHFPDTVACHGRLAAARDVSLTSRDQRTITRRARRSVSWLRLCRSALCWPFLSYHTSPTLRAVARVWSLGVGSCWPALRWSRSDTTLRCLSLAALSSASVSALLKSVGRGPFLCSVVHEADWFGQECSPLLVSELVHPQHRAVYSTIYNSLWYVGSLIGAGVALGT